MTPQEFVATIDIPETLRRVALVAPIPLYCASQWMSAVRAHLGSNYDKYSFRINPMRLHGYIDGHPEPRLAMTFYDPMDSRFPAPTAESDPSLIIITDLTL